MKSRSRRKNVDGNIIRICTIADILDDGFYLESNTKWERYFPAMELEVWR